MDFNNSQGATSTIPHTCGSQVEPASPQGQDDSVKSPSTSSTTGAIPKKQPNPGNMDFNNSQGATSSPHTTGSQVEPASRSAGRQHDSVQSPSTSSAIGAIPKKQSKAGNMDLHVDSSQGAISSPITSGGKIGIKSQSQEELRTQSTSAERHDDSVQSPSTSTTEWTILKKESNTSNNDFNKSQRATNSPITTGTGTGTRRGIIKYYITHSQILI